MINFSMITCSNGLRFQVLSLLELSLEGWKVSLKKVRSSQRSTKSAGMELSTHILLWSGKFQSSEGQLILKFSWSHKYLQGYNIWEYEFSPHNFKCIKQSIHIKFQQYHRGTPLQILRLLKLLKIVQGFNYWVIVIRQYLQYIHNIVSLGCDYLLHQYLWILFDDTYIPFQILRYGWFVNVVHSQNCWGFAFSLHTQEILESGSYYQFHPTGRYITTRVILHNIDILKLTIHTSTISTRVNISGIAALIEQIITVFIGCQTDPIQQCKLSHCPHKPKYFKHYTGLTMWTHCMKRYGDAATVERPGLEGNGLPRKISVFGYIKPYKTIRSCLRGIGPGGCVLARWVDCHHFAFVVLTPCSDGELLYEMTAYYWLMRCLGNTWTSLLTFEHDISLLTLTTSVFSHKCMRSHVFYLRIAIVLAGGGCDCVVIGFQPRHLSNNWCYTNWGAQSVYKLHAHGMELLDAQRRNDE